MTVKEKYHSYKHITYGHTGNITCLTVRFFLTLSHTKFLKQAPLTFDLPTVHCNYLLIVELRHLQLTTQKYQLVFLLPALRYLQTQHHSG